MLPKECLEVLKFLIDGSNFVPQVQRKNKKLVKVLFTEFLICVAKTFQGNNKATVFQWICLSFLGLSGIKLSFLAHVTKFLKSAFRQV